MIETIKTEMTVREFATAIMKLERKIGEKAHITTILMARHKNQMMCCVYANGSYNSDFTVEADTLAELLAATTAKWAEYSDAHRVRTIRAMALAIIRITAELGECTDAALRNCGEFDPGQVKAYGEQACADANDIAGKGPFTIVAIGGANAEAA